MAFGASEIGHEMAVLEVMLGKADSAQSPVLHVLLLPALLPI